ncbi:MAG: hypothetical protein KDE56_10005, partial [Anaerolineales bacterium]|nr:hypothetical protein [Anaerolineales bacterium]
MIENDNPIVTTIRADVGGNIGIQLHHFSDLLPNAPIAHWAIGEDGGWLKKRPFLSNSPLIKSEPKKKKK